MPIFEHACPEPTCSNYAVPIERYAARFCETDPACVICQGPTRRLVSGFCSPLMGVISASKYNDRSIPGPAAFEDGHFAFRKKTLSGKPEPVYIDTFEKQREFCRSEGLVNPSDVGNIDVAADGKSMRSRGMRGQWI